PTSAAAASSCLSRSELVEQFLQCLSQFVERASCRSPVVGSDVLERGLQRIHALVFQGIELPLDDVESRGRVGMLEQRARVACDVVCESEVVGQLHGYRETWMRTRGRPLVKPAPQATRCTLGLRGCLCRIQRFAGLFRDGGKRGWLLYREIRQHFAIDFDAGCSQTADKRAVGHVVLPCRSVDTNDPQPAELALLVLAIAIGVTPSAFDIFLGCLPQLATSTEGTLGRLHDLLLPLQADNVRFDARHVNSLLRPG